MRVDISVWLGRPKTSYQKMVYKCNKNTHLRVMLP